MRLTAVIPATDGPPGLDRVRAAIEAAEEPPEEVIVVDLPERSGPAAARNSAAREASGDVLVFVDSDVIVRPDAFRRIRLAFVEDPALAAVFGSYDDTPECRDLVSSFRNLLHHHVHQRAAGPAVTFWAGLGAMRRDLFLAVGGFDSNRFGRPAIEDVELGLRISANGSAIRLDPELQGTHIKRWSLPQMIRTDLLHRGVPWVGLLLRRRTAPATLSVSWRDRLSACSAVSAPTFAALGRLLPALAALAALAALNLSLYRLVLRRRGPLAAIAALPLHLVHLLTAVAAVPVGTAAHVRELALWRRTLALAEPGPGEGPGRGPGSVTIPAAVASEPATTSGTLRASPRGRTSEPLPAARQRPAGASASARAASAARGLSSARTR